MMQQLAGGGAPFGSGTPLAGEGAMPMIASPNPMAAMMQQMMSNPDQMQQMMQLSQQLLGGGGGFGGGLGGGVGVPDPTGGAHRAAPTVPAAPGAQVTPHAANPIAAMMQQMMDNPAQMQQMANLSQQLMGGGLGGGGLGGALGGGFLGAAAPGSAAADPSANPLAMQMQRQRFASQLQQLLAMGFTNEAACLRVLAEHNGRVDSAIDQLLAMPEASSP